MPLTHQTLSPKHPVMKLALPSRGSLVASSLLPDQASPRLVKVPGRQHAMVTFKLIFVRAPKFPGLMPPQERPITPLKNQVPFTWFDFFTHLHP